MKDPTAEVLMSGAALGLRVGRAVVLTEIRRVDGVCTAHRGEVVDITLVWNGSDSQIVDIAFYDTRPPIRDIVCMRNAMPLEMSFE